MANLFEDVVCKEPEKYIRLFLDSEELFLETFAYMLLSGVSHNDIMNSIENELIQQMFYKIYKYHKLYNNVHRNILEIICKKEDVQWDNCIIENIISIIQNYDEKTRDISNYNDLIRYSDYRY